MQDGANHFERRDNNFAGVGPLTQPFGPPSPEGEGSELARAFSLGTAADEGRYSTTTSTFGVATATLPYSGQRFLKRSTRSVAWSRVTPRIEKRSRTSLNRVTSGRTGWSRSTFPSMRTRAEGIGSESSRAITCSNSTPHAATLVRNASGGV